MKVRKSLNKVQFRPWQWLKEHRRGVGLGLWFILFTAFGGIYYFLSQYYSLPIINPLGTQEGEPLIALSDPVKKEVPHPLTGVYYSSSDAKVWQGRRPL
jgi:hypothetical protein